MKKAGRYKKTVAALTILCIMGSFILTACTGNGDPTYDAGLSGTAGSERDAETAAAAQSPENEFAPSPDDPSVIPAKKEETVHIKADASGTPYEITVEAALSDWESDAPVLDRSNLTGIKNKEGGEAFYEIGDGKILWENMGETIRYEGTGTEELPVGVRVTYYLDGIETAPSDLAGKSGEVRIRFDYENRTQRLAQEAGEENPVCVPFMAISAAVLPGDIFSEIAVTNGKVLSMGEETIVVGYAFPGLAESLQLTSYEPTEEIEIPEYVEITARAEEFELDFTSTIFSTGLFEEIDEADLNDAESLRDDVKELTDATGEIADGAGELEDGAGEFGDYLSKYFEGVQALSSGAAAINQGIGMLSSQADTLGGGAQSMQDALTQIDAALSKVDLTELSEGAGSEEEAAAAAAAASLVNDAAALGSKLGDLQTGLAAIDGFTGQVRTFDEKVTAARETINALSAPSLNTEELSAALAEKYTSAFTDQVRESVGEANNQIRDANGQMQEMLTEAADAACAAVDSQEGLDDQTKESLKAQIRSEILDVSAPSISELSAEEMAEAVDLQIDLGSNATLKEYADNTESLLETAKQAVSEEAVGKPDFSGLEALENLDGTELTAIAGRMQENLQILGQALDSASSMTGALSELAGSMQQLQTAVSQVTQGSAELSKGVSAFGDGIKQLSEGSSQFTQALGQAVSAGDSLGSAYDALTEGLGALSEGLSEFDQETSKELENLAGENYLGLLHRIRAVRRAELSYDNFSGILEGQEGSVRFLVETDAIE